MFGYNEIACSAKSMKGPLISKNFPLVEASEYCHDPETSGDKMEWSGSRKIGRGGSTYHENLQPSKESAIVPPTHHAQMAVSTSSPESCETELGTDVEHVLYFPPHRDTRRASFGAYWEDRRQRNRRMGVG